MFDRNEERFDRMYASRSDEVQGFVFVAVHRPLVLIESYVSGQRVPWIVGDSFHVGYTVTQHLLSLGHRSIGMLQGQPNIAAWWIACAHAWQPCRKRSSLFRRNGYRR